METDNLVFVQLLRLPEVEIWQAQNQKASQLTQGPLEAYYNKELDLLFFQCKEWKYAINKGLSTYGSFDDPKLTRSYLLPDVNGFFLLKGKGKSSEPRSMNFENLLESYTHFYRGFDLESQLKSYDESSGLFSKGGELANQAYQTAGSLASQGAFYTSGSADKDAKNPNHVSFRKTEEMRLVSEEEAPFEKFSRSEALALQNKSSQISQSQKGPFWDKLSSDKNEISVNVQTIATAQAQDRSTASTESKYSETTTSSQSQEKPPSTQSQEKPPSLVTQAKEGANNASSKLSSAAQDVKEKASQKAEEAQKKQQELQSQAKESWSDLSSQASGLISDLKDQISKRQEELKHTQEELKAQAKSNINKASDELSQKTSSLKEQASQKAGELQQKAESTQKEAQESWNQAKTQASQKADELQQQASNKAEQYKPQPSESQPQPSGYQPQPSESQPQPSGYQPQPSESQPQPNESQPLPIEGQPQPLAIEAPPQSNESKPQPSESQPQPSGYKSQSSESQPQPSESQPQPSGYQPQPSESQPQPSGYQPQPSESQPQPSGYQPQPTESQPQPSGYQPQPSKYQPQPTESQPQPSESQPQPSGYQPQPTESQPQPSGYQPQPSESQPQPQPSESQPQPSQAKSQPSTTQPTPSVPEEHNLRESAKIISKTFHAATDIIALGVDTFKGLIAPSDADQLAKKTDQKLEKTEQKLSEKAPQLKEQAQSAANQANEKISQAKEQAKNTAEQASEKYSELKEQAQTEAQNAKNQANEKASQLKDQVQSANNQINEKVSELKQQAQDSAEKATNQANEKVSNLKEKAQSSSNQASDKANQVKDQISSKTQDLSSKSQTQPVKGLEKDNQPLNKDVKSDISSLKQDKEPQSHEHHHLTTESESFQPASEHHHLSTESQSFKPTEQSKHLAEVVEEGLKDTDHKLTEIVEQDSQGPSYTEKAKQSAQSASKQLSEKSSELSGKAQSYADQAKQSAQSASQQLSGKAQSYVDQAKQSAQSTSQQLSGKVNEYKSKLSSGPSQEFRDEPVKETSIHGEGHSETIQPVQSKLASQPKPENVPGNPQNESTEPTKETPIDEGEVQKNLKDQVSGSLQNASSSITQTGQSWLGKLTGAYHNLTNKSAPNPSDESTPNPSDKSTPTPNPSDKSTPTPNPSDNSQPQPSTPQDESLSLKDKLIQNFQNVSQHISGTTQEAKDKFQSEAEKSTSQTAGEWEQPLKSKEELKAKLEEAASQPQGQSFAGKISESFQSVSGQISSTYHNVTDRITHGKPETLLDEPQPSLKERVQAGFQTISDKLNREDKSFHKVDDGIKESVSEFKHEKRIEELGQPQLVSDNPFEPLGDKEAENIQPLNPKEVVGGNIVRLTEGVRNTHTHSPETTRRQQAAEASRISRITGTISGATDQIKNRLGFATNPDAADSA